ncbi:hypothetical protein DPMN_175087 [Dreissena polymorpha]|uniref:Uncharacterized protein n=1 Tax=Dreissena polymorpha TaxID=45954 RepID=A0A9D4IHR9_DREPO|nr:hypothetical protein DPMN_175087 [Dreissena polymorpha]
MGDRSEQALSWSQANDRASTAHAAGTLIGLTYRGSLWLSLVAKQVDHWITGREKNLVGHFLIKCPIRRKELVFARQTVRQGVETTWYVGRERDVEDLSKNK